MSARQVERLRKQQAERLQARNAAREQEREEIGEPIVFKDMAGRVIRTLPPPRRIRP